MLAWGHSEVEAMQLRRPPRSLNSSMICAGFREDDSAAAFAILAKEASVVGGGGGRPSIGPA